MPVSLIPDGVYPSIYAIAPQALARRGITLVLADLDNTLAKYGQKEPDDQVRSWKEGLERAGITLFLLSNSRKPGRAARFAQALGIPCSDGLSMLVAQAKAKAETLTVTVNGAAKDVATAFDAQGNTYYRLRDLAFALKGTGAQFNVTWDGSVAVATGSAYEGEALAMPGSAPTGEAVSLTLTVDGTAVSQPAVLVNGNYYLAEGFLAQLGAESALVEGVLAINAA